MFEGAIAPSRHGWVLNCRSLQLSSSQPRYVRSIAPDERPSGYPVFSACARTNGRPTERAKPFIWCNLPHVRSEPILTPAGRVRAQAPAILALVERLKALLEPPAAVSFTFLYPLRVPNQKGFLLKSPEYWRELHKCQQPFATLFPTYLNGTL